PCRFADPARFSFAHGGKDSHPFPVPLKVYDETISVMKTAVQKAKLGRDDRLAALKRLDDEARLLERLSAGPPVADVIADERRLSHSFAGRSVFGWAPAPEGWANERNAASARRRAACPSGSRARTKLPPPMI